ncbi:MAG: ArsR/SmtB family transcription factor [Gammaproteobacteria bacterium]
MSRRSSAHAERDAAQIFAALGDSTRLMLVVKLSDGQPRSIVGLTADFHLSRQAVTKHLRALEQAGIVRSNRIGRESRFSYIPEPVEKTRSYLAAVSEQWDDALSRLKTFVENK